MDILIEDTFSDTEFLTWLVGENPVPAAIEGIELSVGIDCIADKERFVESLWARIGDAEDRIVRKDARKHGTPKGHADYKIESDGRDPIFLEMKYNGDHLRPSQWEWLLEAMKDGKTVWVCWVDFD